MKQINGVKVFTELQRKRDYVAAIQLMVLQQIDVVASLLERNAEHVISPYCYNACAGLIDQLKLQAFAAFVEHGGHAPHIPIQSEDVQFTITHGE